MCKISFAKTKDGTAYEKAITMIEHQENVVAGQSTGTAYIDRKGVHLRKAVGKVINFKAKYPDIPKTNMCLFHSRWATTGAINEDNQHPISIMYKGKRIGYGVHNGVWSDYRNFEYLRNNNLTNKTDSALLFTLYSKILEKYGDNPINRRKALGTMRNLVKGESNNNFVIMFNDGQVIFSGNNLTYKQSKDVVGIMTFGLPNKIDFYHIYEVKGYNVLKFQYQSFDYVFEPKPPQQENKPNTYVGCCQSTLNQYQSKYFMMFEGDTYKLYNENYLTQEQAQNKGEILKARYGIKFRTIANKRKLWSLYVRGKTK